MEREFPYEACSECLYRVAEEDRKNYGPRSIATINEEKACNKNTCKLESTLAGSSAKLLNRKN